MKEMAIVIVIIIGLGLLSIPVFHYLRSIGTP